jgi:hypothetical protein
MTDLQGDEGRILRSLYKALQEGPSGETDMFLVADRIRKRSTMVRLDLNCYRMSESQYTVLWECRD